MAERFDRVLSDQELLAKELTDLQQDTRSIGTSFRDTTSIIEQLQQVLPTTQRSFLGVTLEVFKAATEYKQNSVAITELTDRYNDHLDQLQERIVAERNTYDSVSAELAEKKSVIEALQAQRSQLKEQFAATEALVAATKESIAQKQVELQLQDQKIASIKTDIATSNQREVSILAELGALRTREQTNAGLTTEEQGLRTSLLEELNTTLLATKDNKAALYEENARRYGLVGQLSTIKDQLKNHESATKLAATAHHKQVAAINKSISQELQGATALVAAKKTSASKLALLGEAADKTARELDAQTGEIKTDTWKHLNRAASMVAQALTDLVKTIRETQTALGISPGNALNVVLGNFTESIKSFFSFNLTASRRDIQSTREAFRSEFGGVISDEASGDLTRQRIARGLSPQEQAQSRRAFMTQAMGNRDQAIVAEERLIAKFEQRSLTAKDAVEAITKNSEIFARNGARFADSFTKAAINAKQIGVDLGKVDQIGDNIIGNFEGFLEKQAELGAMGFNLDSSRLAQIAESGDTGALFEELRSQLANTGKDITKLRRSEQLALSGAFGISMTDMQRLAAPPQDDKTIGGSGDPLELQRAGNDTLAIIADKLGKILGFVTTIAGLLAGRRILESFRTRGTGGTGGGIRGGRAPATRGRRRNQRGRATGTGRTVPRTPSTGTRGISMASRLGGLTRGASRLLGRAALPLAAALDFSGRKNEGQSTTKAAVGTTGGLGGALVGGATGAKAGSLVGGGIGSLFAGVGAAPGAAVGGAIGSIIGSIAGYFAGGKLADTAMDAMQPTGNKMPIQTSTSIPQSIINDPAPVRDDVFEKMTTLLTTIATTLRIDHSAFFTKLVANTTSPAPTTGPTTVQPASQVTATSTTPADPKPQQIVVDFRKIEDKLDAVIRAIGSMQVHMDGKEVGKVLVNVTETASQVGVMRAQSRSAF